MVRRAEKFTTLIMRKIIFLFEYISPGSPHVAVEISAWVGEMSRGKLCTKQLGEVVINNGPCSLSIYHVPSAGLSTACGNLIQSHNPMKKELFQPSLHMRRPRLRTLTKLPKDSWLISREP